MGLTLFDRYTYLHFAVGVVIYFYDISLLQWSILHTVFEVLENTPSGMYFISNYIKVWPGGKSFSDSLINSTGDTIGAILGWISGYILDYILGNKNYIIPI